MSPPAPGERGASVPRLALSYAEAAEALGVSPDTFERHVLPRLRVTPVGARRLVAVAEIERFLATRQTTA